MCNFNPKYWVTRYTVVDIASRKNACEAVQAENLPLSNPVHHSGSIVSAAFRVRNLSKNLVALSKIELPVGRLGDDPAAAKFQPRCYPRNLFF
jgi:hypothetical protein